MHNKSEGKGKYHETVELVEDELDVIIGGGAVIEERTGITQNQFVANRKTAEQSWKVTVENISAKK